MTWTFDYDLAEIQDGTDGTVLFDLHNATDEEATLVAAAPDMLAALEANRDDESDHYAADGGFCGWCGRDDCPQALIAAAPQLYEVLLKWERFMEDNYNPEDISWWYATKDALRSVSSDE